MTTAARLFNLALVGAALAALGQGCRQPAGHDGGNARAGGGAGHGAAEEGAAQDAGGGNDGGGVGITGVGGGAGAAERAGGAAAGGEGGRGGSRGEAGSGAGGSKSAGGSWGSGGTGDVGAPVMAAPDGPGALFSGTSMTVNKLVSGDPQPGYFYAQNSGQNVVLKFEPAAPDPALPTHIRFVIHVEVPKPGAVNLVIGFNFRQDQSEREFGWFDARGYAGIEYYTRASWSALAYGATTLEGNNFSSTPAAGARKGTCTGVCAPVHGTAVQVARNQWARERHRFVPDFTAVNPAAGHDLAVLGRIDLIHSIKSNDPPLSVWITGVRLLTAQQFAQ